MDLRLLGWDEEWERAFAEAAEEGAYPARVALDYQHIYRLYTPKGEKLGRIEGRMRHVAATREGFPAVGDWVVARDAPVGDEAVIEAVLPRRSRFLRKAAGKAHVPQVVAANIDVLFIVVGLDHDFNPRRIERYLVTAYDSGARPVVVLNKADLWDEVDDFLEMAEEVAPGVPVLPVSARTGQGMEALRPYLAPGKTVAFVGSSGVGKSSLVNRLLGEERQKVAEVRASDSRGRHTTRHRELLVLPDGALLVDTPGMRSLQLWEASEALDEAFADIAALAADCRFKDCTHEAEPGCAVRAAIEEERLDPERFENYKRLKLEAKAKERGLRARDLETRRPRRRRPSRKR
ncbi:MAG TPA: ribosome small subunit-dependent GTPase A [Fredinandcohnia sp.]|nr:ribosome small subunit-dependent GTPase A [Fredinandcohnia sp.]